MNQILRLFFFYLLHFGFTYAMKQPIDDAFDNLNLTVQRSQLESRIYEIDKFFLSNENFDPILIINDKFIFAIDKSYWDVVEYMLINFKDNLYISDKSGEYLNPLNYAIENGAPIYIIKLFVNSGADVNFMPIDSFYHRLPPLGEALSNNLDYKIVQYLIEEGALVDFQDDKNSTTYIDIALMYDDPNGQKNLFLLLFNGANLNLSYIDPLKSALSERKSVLVIAILLNYGVNVDTNFVVYVDDLLNYSDCDQDYLVSCLAYSSILSNDRKLIDINYVTLPLNELDSSGYYLNIK